MDDNIHKLEQNTGKFFKILLPKRIVALNSFITSKETLSIVNVRLSNNAPSSPKFAFLAHLYYLHLNCFENDSSLDETTKNYKINYK